MLRLVTGAQWGMNPLGELAAREREKEAPTSCSRIGWGLLIVVTTRGAKMAITDRFTKKARSRLEEQVAPSERIILSATVGPVGMVLTDQRLMMAPYVRGIEPDVNLPLSAIHNVEYTRPLLSTQGTLTIHTSSQTFTYKTPNKQGEPAAAAIRQAIAHTV